jgi:hypothetical protein
MLIGLHGHLPYVQPDVLPSKLMQLDALAAEERRSRWRGFLLSVITDVARARSQFKRSSEWLADVWYLPR